MGFFSKKPKVVPDITIESLEKLVPGMSAADAVNLLGRPGFKMDSADAFSGMGFVPAWARGKKNWVYKTPHGEFQLIVQDETTVAEVKFVEGLITKMREAQQ